VEVVRFICENTIEERVLEIQNQKKQLINMTITSSKEDKKIANIEMYKKIFDL
jgi:SNF2 family DNA or RNA helicase